MVQSLGESKKKRKRVRVRWGRVFGALLLLCIFIIGVYSVYQYIQGTVEANNKSFKNDKGNYSFQGKNDEIGAVNVLLLGSDSRGEKQARTDTIMVAHYDQRTHTVKLISFMRDMYTSIPGHGKGKLNAAYAYGGPELLRETITENFNLDINYYAIVDFKGFEEAVDILVPDGIQVDVPHVMSSGIGMELEKGKQILHGKELLGYVRFRQDRLSDFGRVQRQQEVVSKIMEESISIDNVAKLPKLLGILNSYVNTNMDTSTLFTIGKDIVTKKSGDLETLRIPEDGTFQNKRYEDNGEVLEVDFQQNKEALKEFLVGE
ncbi:LytR family transcriptional regulator [Metabacillus sediminilitoris]|uniref:Regulatory protein MsrR n=1 Tax=Metabacillus sediminilitoris TaxID=2567941 RepID=A0A4S4C165_9BACI|nr:LytR family transcriptional regulator [Metabacillus sediminilitoris]THF81383.1 LytR family transcriptional regulator [Metabacillus sediminilitoris]